MNDPTDELWTVLEMTRRIAAGPDDLGALLAGITEATRAILRCERSSVSLLDAQRDELVVRTSSDLAGVRFPASLGLSGATLKSDSVINVEDAYADPRFNPEADRRSGFRTRSVLSVPLPGLDGQAIGVIQALNKDCGAFGARDERLLQVFSAQAGVAIQRQLARDAEARRRHVERDLRLAQDIQRGLLPRKAPKLRGFDIAGWNLPAEETGGDFFDFIPLDEDRLAFVLADVSGHGLGPALIVAECRALLRACLPHHDDPVGLLGQVNDLLCEDLPDDRFVTVGFGILDAKVGRLRTLSAGHGPILVHRRASDDFEVIEPHGCPLGLFPGWAGGPTAELTLEPGDQFLIFSDGFHEWPDRAGESFGMGRLREGIRRHRDLDADRAIQAIRADVCGFAGETPQSDDLTAVVIRRVG